MTMLTKTLAVEVKAVGDEDSGRFQAYFSVFGNVDSYGDMVVKGAFADDLDRWGPKGSGIPIYWRHRMDDPMLNLGASLEVAEDDFGALVDGQLDLENSYAAYTYKLMREGRVRQMSFAYDIVEAGWVEKTEDGKTVSYYELRKLKIHEISIVPVGANQETEILAVKSAQEAARAALTDARRKADDPAAALDESVDGEDQGTEDDPANAKTDEPAGAKADERTTEQSKQHLGIINITKAL
ncbi:HK97 family phage prohead protease [Microbacterium sp. 2FI]|uniref:HK97 family phage prohead protease n=1 Tax=Microbacterium sp. 2FI TaxID=2502193 RepID=UPI0010F6E38F|nr:HK97 family phage prohead protease [Microbacterium sp. 2FI]